MLVSCSSDDFGAKYKDQQIKSKADYEDLINPVKDLPTDYLKFTFDGKVQPIQQNVKGKKTIAFFNLNEKRLAERRKTTVTNLLKMREFLTEEEMVDFLFGNAV